MFPARCEAATTSDCDERPVESHGNVAIVVSAGDRAVVDALCIEDRPVADAGARREDERDRPALALAIAARHEEHLGGPLAGLELVALRPSAVLEPDDRRARPGVAGKKGDAMLRAGEARIDHRE